MENLSWTGKAKRITGAALGHNREEATNPPTQPQTTQAGDPTQPLQCWWDVPGGVGRWEGVKGKGKLLWSINTHFPYTTSKLQQHPAGYFQISTISQCKNQVFPRKTPSQKNPRKAPTSRAGSGQREPRCQGCSSWTRCIPGSGISISFLEQSKPDANSSTFHASAAIRVSTLNPTTSKRLFINKKVCRVLGRAQVTFPSAFPRHPTRFYSLLPAEAAVSPTSGMFEWHLLDQGARESIIPLSPQAERKRKLLSARPSAF